MRKTNELPESKGLDAPLVSGSITLTANLPPKFVQAVIDFHNDFNVKLISVNDLNEQKGYRDDNWRQVIVEGSNDDLVRLNRHCENIAYADS